MVNKHHIVRRMSIHFRWNDPFVGPRMTCDASPMWWHPSTRSSRTRLYLSTDLNRHWITRKHLVEYSKYRHQIWTLYNHHHSVAQERWRMFVPYTLQIQAPRLHLSGATQLSLQRFPVAAVARAACGTPTWQTKVRECGANSHTMRPWE